MQILLHTRKKEGVYEGHSVSHGTYFLGPNMWRHEIEYVHTYECMWHVAIRWENICRNHWYEASKPHVLNHGSFLYCGIGSERG